jgi:hypothetical protein
MFCTYELYGRGVKKSTAPPVTLNALDDAAVGADEDSSKDLLPCPIEKALVLRDQGNSWQPCLEDRRRGWRRRGFLAEHRKIEQSEKKLGDTCTSLFSAAGEGRADPKVSGGVRTLGVPMRTSYCTSHNLS